MHSAQFSLTTRILARPPFLGQPCQHPTTRRSRSTSTHHRSRIRRNQLAAEERVRSFHYHDAPAQGRKTGRTITTGTVEGTHPTTTLTSTVANMTIVENNQKRQSQKMRARDITSTAVAAKNVTQPPTVIGQPADQDNPTPRIPSGTTTPHRKNDISPKCRT